MIRLITAGESHGPALTAILEGLPAGLPLSADTLAPDMARRRMPLGAGGRMAIETDAVEITGGVMAGKTTGAPVAFFLANADHAAWKGKEVPAFTCPRPGHADGPACAKYGYDDVRFALERASARETAMRVAAGACCRAFLASFGIELEGRVAVLGGETDPNRFEAAIEKARAEGETLGGEIEVVATGLPVGLGSHVSADRRLDARLAAAVVSVPAIKGVSFGAGFALAAKKGTETDDLMGGLAGGISDGTPLVLTAAMKPIPTTRKPRPTVDWATGEKAETGWERSDVCPVPRAVVVVEAAVALVLADALVEKLGGDSMDEMRARFAALPDKVRLDPAPKTFWS